MALSVHLPKVGMTMEEGDLVRWLVPDGTSVTRGQPIFEMETEKISMEVEADGEGVLRQLVSAGTTLKPGSVVGCLLTDGESEVPPEIQRQAGAPPGAAVAPPAEPAATNGAAAPAPAAGAPVASAAPAPPAAPAPVAAGPASRPVASPAARRLAQERGVDLAVVAGSGPGGRIVEADILAAAERAQRAPAASTAAPASAPPAAGEQRVPYSGRRRATDERMHQSLQAMAQLTLSSEVRMDVAMEMLHGLNREWRTERVVATATVLVIRAAALALREHPRLNARLEDDSIVVSSTVDVGFAVQADEGLIVPVLRGADRCSLQDLARAFAALTERAQASMLTVDDVSGGTFTVTSLETTEVDAFTPVVNPPQAAILGLGRVREIVAFEGSQPVRAQATTLSLSFDHRVIDGAPAARFLGRVAELLGRPYMLM